MSLSDIRPYFRTHFTAEGFTEWKDGFGADNIPENIIDKAFHIDGTSTIGGISNNQADMDTGTAQLVRFFIKGFRNPADAIDKAYLKVENILKRTQKSSNRLTTLLDVVFEGASILPLADSNDNAVLVEMNFTARVIVDVEN
jgi:hypothetical protein